MSDTLTTFRQLRVGQAFRVRHDANGDVEGGGRQHRGPLTLSEAVYTKIKRGVCKDADGQWLDVHPQTVVRLELAGQDDVQAAHEAHDPHCTCPDCILSHVSRLADPDPDATCDHCGRRLGTCGNCGQLVCFECHDRDVCRMGQDDDQDCPDCPHPLTMHHRHASGAYRCTSFGCGCEQASVEARTP